MRECPDCEIPLRRGVCGKCGWKVESAKPKIKFIKDCSWRGKGAPCTNIATMYPLTFDPNAEGLCGEHWSKSHEPMTVSDDEAAKTAMTAIRRILTLSAVSRAPSPADDENAGW